MGSKVIINGVMAFIFSFSVQAYAMAEGTSIQNFNCFAEVMDTANSPLGFSSVPLQNIAETPDFSLLMALPAPKISIYFSIKANPDFFKSRVKIDIVDELNGNIISASGQPQNLEDGKTDSFSADYSSSRLGKDNSKRQLKIHAWCQPNYAFFGVSK